MPALAAFLDDREAWDRVLVGSFSVRRLRDFRRIADPRVATSAHLLEVLAFLALPGGPRRPADRPPGGRPAGPAPAPAGQVPIRVAGPGLVRRAHAAGKHVHVWTIDDPDEMHELLDRGVDGLFTDRTDLLKSVLIERGQWRDAP